MSEKKDAYTNCPQCEAAALDQKVQLERDRRGRLKEGFVDCELCGGTGRVQKYRCGVDRPQGIILEYVCGATVKLVAMPRGVRECRRMDCKIRVMGCRDGAVCSGCDRICRMPLEVQVGDEIKVVSRECICA